MFIIDFSRLPSILRFQQLSEYQTQHRSSPRLTPSPHHRILDPSCCPSSSSALPSWLTLLPRKIQQAVLRVTPTIQSSMSIPLIEPPEVQCASSACWLSFSADYPLKLNGVTTSGQTALSSVAGTMMPTRPGCNRPLLTLFKRQMSTKENNCFAVS